MSAKSKGIWGWMFFDWASQPFHTLIITFIFAPYFAAQVAETPVIGQELWGYAAGAAAVIVAVLAPVLGAVADASGPRKPWVLGFSVFYVVGAWALWWGLPGDPEPFWVLAAFAIGLIGVEFTTVFTNSMLPLLGSKQEVGRISGSGWAMGYWGGLLSLVIVLGLMVPAPGAEVTLLGVAPVFGLDPALGEGARATGPLTAIWYVVFIIPLFLWTPDTARRPRVAGAAADGLRQLGRTLRALPSDRSFLAFLGGSMFYRDALAGLYTFGGIYAAGVLGWGTFQLGVFGIIAAGAGAVGAWIGGRMDERRGPKPVIALTVMALIVVSAAIISTSPTEVLFLPVAEGSALPTVAFYICGSVIGGAGGSLQAASRTMLVRQAAPERMGEAFGIYALAGKATSFLAPFSIAVVTGLSESQRVGVTPVLALFALGLLLMVWVSADREG
jgi:UMF1 family MFS transporter